MRNANRIFDGKPGGLRLFVKPRRKMGVLKWVLKK
jgi:hypothetical protein